MGVQSEIDKLATDISDSYAAVQEMGGTVPEEGGSSRLADAVRSIPTGPIEGEATLMPVTEAEYNALTEEEKMADDKAWLVTDAEGASGGSASSAGEVYSREEQRIGTWIDGKPLYKKVYKVTPQWTGSNQSFSLNIPELESIVEQQCMLRYVTRGTPQERVYNLPCAVYNGTTLQYEYTFFTDVVNKVFVIKIQSNQSIQTSDATVILKYTKTTN